MLTTKPSRVGICPSFSSVRPSDPIPFFATTSEPTPIDSYDDQDARYDETFFRDRDLFATPPYFPLVAPSVKSAADIANELIAFTMQNKIDKRWLSGVIDKGLSLGPVPQLQCVFKSPELDAILDRPGDYGDLSDLLAELDSKESDLTSCLSLVDKIVYGLQLRNFGDDLQSQPEFFDGFTLRFAHLMGSTPGQCAVNLFCYFFRQDRLDSESKQVLDLFHDRLKKIVANML